MSTHWSKDISDMHQKFGVNKWFNRHMRIRNRYSQCFRC